MSEQGIKSGKRDKRLYLLFLCAALGIGLLIFAGGEWNSEEGEEASAISVMSREPSAYAEEVEAQVIAICSRVDGAGQVSAVVTLKGGYRTVYASDSQSSSSGYKSNTVLIGSGSSEQAIPIGYENPQIAGIGIVCTGADSMEVRKEILSLVSAAFDIPSNKIYITAGRVS